MSKIVLLNKHQKKALVIELYKQGKQFVYWHRALYY